MNSTKIILIYCLILQILIITRKTLIRIFNFLFLDGSGRYYKRISNLILLMRESGHINRQEQVKVVIRLKPDIDQSRYSKCVYLSDNDDNQLVVETDQKRQIFMFDHVANQNTSQVDIYRMIGEECVQQCLEGYNGCIFAYGQTGAGKTYSVLGSLSDLNTDIYCENRGILPRLLEQFFDSIKTKSEQKQTLICSYMEIYNQQIYDLLCPDKRIHQIRQDAKKGVFVEGLIERKIDSYKSAVAILLEGEKTRRMAATLMNTQSSRSHAIFSLQLKSQTIEEGVTKMKKAKLHVIDLAGSQRIKHTNAEGERLRQGCNINKSLHVLGNVINALVESAKKKKHIPFRDSKLTHYLKDSLSGNSITKLLANIHTGKQYLGDTLSTLMFAKRAKILKMKVEVNQTTAQNFDALRKQIRKLREQLAQARYFKADVRTAQQTNIESNQSILFDRVNTQLLSEGQNSIKNQELKILQQNQKHFKALIEIYEEHMKTCLTQSQKQRKENMSSAKQRKNLQRRYTELTHIIKQLPSFTKIYRENLLLKSQIGKPSKAINEIPKAFFSQSAHLKMDGDCSKEQVQQIVSYYQSVICELQLKFKEWIMILQNNYQELQTENKLKDKMIKQLKKKRDYPPDLQQLKDQNQYLHLNILNLQNQIARLQKDQNQLKLEAKQQKRDMIRMINNKTQLSECDDESINDGLLERLIQIKKQAEKDVQISEAERNQMLNVIKKLQAEVNKLNCQINNTKHANTQNKIRRKDSFSYDKAHTLEPKALFKSTDFGDSAVQQTKIMIRPTDIEFEKGNLLPEGYTRQLLALKLDAKRKQKQISDLKKDLQLYINGDRQIQDEFGKTIEQIIIQYRQIKMQKMLYQSKSVKQFHKQMQTTLNQSNLTVKNGHHSLKNQTRFLKDEFLSLKKKRKH